MQVINTLSDSLKFIARYAGGTVPQTTDAQYAEWVGWINEGQGDMAENGFWSRLLTKADLDISRDTDTVALPEDFYKRNGIYVLEVNGNDWNEPYNDDKQKLFVNIDESGQWVINFLGFTPTEDVTGTLWYFRHPAILVNPDDVFVLSGTTASYYALAEYFRQAGELGSLDDARNEYVNRFDDNLSLDMLPTQQELLSFRSYYNYRKQPTNEKNFYSRLRNRRT